MNDLTMWTIYDHPRDHPTKFVARRWIINSEGNHPASEILEADDIDDLRREFLRCGLVCLTRNPEDDPVIVETWL
jgi:hypothetical protein